MIIRPHWIRFVCSLLLLFCAVTYGSQATVMTVKAQLAQVLLLVAWERSQHSDVPVRPWPWADTQAVALLTVPRLGVKQVVLNSHSGEAMAFGPGLVTVGKSHVLGGHRDSHLNFLKDIESGDSIEFFTADGASSEYIVDYLEVVDSTQSPSFTPPPDSLTLITCFPFDALASGGPLRFLVTAYPLDGSERENF